MTCRIKTKREKSGGMHETRGRTAGPGQRGNSKVRTPREHVILCAVLGRAAEIQKGRRALSNEKETSSLIISQEKWARP